MFEAGANYFILTVKPRVLIPMHYFHRSDVALEYSRTASCRSTEVIAMPEFGEKMTLEVDEEGYFNIQMKRAPRAGEPDAPVSPETAGGNMPEGGAAPVPPAEQGAPDSDLPDPLSGEDPFAESDLPISMLSDSESEEL